MHKILFFVECHPETKIKSWVIPFSLLLHCQKSNRAHSYIAGFFLFCNTEIACSSIMMFCQNVSFISIKSPLGEMTIENDVS